MISQELHLISLGAGVQSSTMALMAAKGELQPMPYAAIFADTGAEPEKVYEWLDWLETQLPFPVYRVMQSKGLKEDLLVNSSIGKRSSNPPFFTANGGMLNRKCTVDFKVAPIKRMVREIMSITGHTRSRQWIGISTDEAVRMKPSGVQYSIHRWPLIEHGISRGDCLAWMERNYPGRVPPKSACTFCPYHSDEIWQEMKDSDPESWAEAVEIDAHVREGFAGSTERVFVHRQCVPLPEVRLQAARAVGQTDMFDNECEGMCGV